MGGLHISIADMPEPTPPTVRVAWDNPQGWALINEADYDPGQHQLYDWGVELKTLDFETATVKVNAGAFTETESSETELPSDTSENPPAPEPKQRKRRNPVDLE